MFNILNQGGTIRTRRREACFISKIIKRRKLFSSAYDIYDFEDERIFGLYMGSVCTGKLVAGHTRIFYAFGGSLFVYKTSHIRHTEILTTWNMLIDINLHRRSSSNSLIVICIFCIFSTIERVGGATLSNELDMDTFSCVQPFSQKSSMAESHELRNLSLHVTRLRNVDAAKWQKFKPMYAINNRQKTVQGIYQLVEEYNPPTQPPLVQGYLKGSSSNTKPLNLYFKILVLPSRNM
ncbi:unnamed protein product [Nesidiocoris tenuis]|uniref:Uncharacterized protein n=1 Tax=Nesidiocoris tenuis TaxID=355587 RepID=A0A6H5HJY7_9HEMI|nr:unnamed protein product [Nesidiocoris tenuis]